MRSTAARPPPRDCDRRSFLRARSQSPCLALRDDSAGRFICRSLLDRGRAGGGVELSLRSGRLRPPNGSDPEPGPLRGGTAPTPAECCWIAHPPDEGAAPGPFIPHRDMAIELRCARFHGRANGEHTPAKAGLLIGSLCATLRVIRKVAHTAVSPDGLATR